MIFHGNPINAMDAVQEEMVKENPYTCRRKNEWWDLYAITLTSI